MAHGFQARLDEMLHSRQVQLRRLSDETQQQAGKRELLRERRAALRGIQHQVLLLKQKLAHLDVQMSAAEEDLDERKTRIEKLATEKRELEQESQALERTTAEQATLSRDQTSEINKFRARVEAQVARALEEGRLLQESADEMELVLRTMRAEGEAAARTGLELASRREALAVQAEVNLAAKCVLEEEVEVANRSLLLLERSASERAEDVRSLQVDSERVEHELLEMLR